MSCACVHESLCADKAMCRRDVPTLCVQTRLVRYVICTRASACVRASEFDVKDRRATNLEKKVRHATIGPCKESKSREFFARQCEQERGGYRAVKVVYVHVHTYIIETYVHCIICVEEEEEDLQFCVHNGGFPAPFGRPVCFLDIGKEGGD